MGISLEEYAAIHSQEPPPESERQAIAQTAKTMRDRQREREMTADLKTSIAQQLAKGNAPETVLYSAIRLIGLLTHDEEWEAAQTATLDSVYADLAQQSLLTDNAAIAAQRLDDRQTQYLHKMHKKLNSQLTECRKLEKALVDALTATEAMQQVETE